MTMRFDRHTYADNPEHRREFFEALAAELPPYIARREVGRFLGGMLTGKTLANMDAAGKGPAVAYSVGRMVVYRREALLEWLQERYPVQRITARAEV